MIWSELIFEKKDPFHFVWYGKDIQIPFSYSSGVDIEWVGGFKF